MPRSKLATRRSIEPLFSTRDVADVLGKSTDFVRGETDDGFLRCAVEIRRPGRRTQRSYALSDVRIYCVRHARGALERVNALARELVSSQN